ncbi:MAG: transglycosylase SLT domain-containing protein [Kofleriaceae bacterium]|nr:transglycosylase SLT domain-containing protein [Kofleriaceae bacterium]
MRIRGILISFSLLFTACAAEEGDLEWVAPLDTDQVPVGDAIELAVATQHPDAARVRFELDGTELAVCDPAQPEEDCKRDDVWRWTTVFDRPGMHEVVATSLDADGNEVESVVRPIFVVTELKDLDGIDERDELEISDGADTAEEPDDIGTLAAATRGLLDPDRPYHRIFGGISWRVVNQRVRLHTGTPSGSVASVRTCMNRYGASIRKWADHYKLSRASVAATALTESSCTNPAGSSDGLSSGPMQVTASTCAALMGLSRSTCRARMHSRPDFSFQVGAKYMGSSYQRNQHHRDPPKIAAAYNAGSLRSTSSNRWHMVSTGNHIDRFVRWYNAYRAWEAQ